MKRVLLLLLAGLLIAGMAAVGFAQEQDWSQAKVITPRSTVGLAPGMVKTRLFIVEPKSGFTPNSPPEGAENPGSIACVYGVTPPTSGCPLSGAPVASGGSKAIAVVDYGHNSTLQADFNAFNTEYGLPAQTLQFICDCGDCPSSDGSGWDVETALDTQYAHSMAPNAQIIVAQFCSDPYAGGDSAAEYLASQAVAALGGGEVSNSFGYGGEFSGELSYDQYMTTPTIVYFASTGDSGYGTDYPESSPNVVAAGGTRIRRSNGLWTGEEDCWNGSGGGFSQYEALPNYQFIIANLAGTHRATPDWGSDASTSSPVAIYSSTGCGGWCAVGGTSVSSPTQAGITNAAGHFQNHTSAELQRSYLYYKNPGLYHHYFYDVTVGTNGYPGSFFGWDGCTGLGAPRVLSGF
jgi:subtilase family serine protease